MLQNYPNKIFFFLNDFTCTSRLFRNEICLPLIFYFWEKGVSIHSFEKKNTKQKPKYRKFKRTHLYKNN